MFSFGFSQIATATVGALLLATVSISAAVGPARVVETTPVVYASAVVQSGVVANG